MRVFTPEAKKPDAERERVSSNRLRQRERGGLRFLSDGTLALQPADATELRYSPTRTIEVLSAIMPM
jgi:hypothetical protein